MRIFEKFKQAMPSNEQLCERAVTEVLSGKGADFVKANFSELMEMVNRHVYGDYLKAQSQVGSPLLRERFEHGTSHLFEDLDEFFMSIFQSRKSRAGGAFEFMIRTMFKHLGYPFSEQINIDGATPDFVLPSEERFRRQPLDCIIFTAKRTLRERWRQVVTEANKGYAFFLATIDEKVSKNQIEQMAKHKVFLVVPRSIKQTNLVYAKSYNVLSFEDFFAKHLDPALRRWE